VTPRLTVERAASMMGWSKGKLSKLENGQRGIAPEEVSALCTIYGATDHRRDDLVARASANDPALWEKSLPGVPQESATLASYEAEATRMVSWQPMLIPGLLQTMSYMKAFMRQDGIAPDQAEARAMARLRRQQVLRGKVEYVAFIGEFALGVPVGGPAVMTEQLREVVIVAQRPNVTVRVVPNDAVHSGLLGQWLLLEFAVARPIAHIEQLRSALFLEGEDAEPYVEAVTRLHAVSMTETESLRVIGEMAEAMEGRADGRNPVEEVD
jgi:transcriptional regulator with XRE-family HTH domain